MATPITSLVLRNVPISPSFIIQMIEREMGRPLTHERRYYLADQPVHCGDLLEVFCDGEWIGGRYEWTAKADDEPTLETANRVYWLNGSELLRWPE